MPGIADYELRIEDLQKTDATRAAELRAQESVWSRWPKNPIDSFVLARLLSEGLTPSKEAAAEKLCRRLYLDLTGLPPTPTELDAFLQSASLEIRKVQFSPLVDRLLASPRYGERMVWEWLDAARYADTNGYQGDPMRAMWYWRDWAIKALNENMPFDQFTIEQIAGDLLPEPADPGAADAAVSGAAAGFLEAESQHDRAHRHWLSSQPHDQWRRRPHRRGIARGLREGPRGDHRRRLARPDPHLLPLPRSQFDPILQREYYQLSAYFNSIEETGANDAGGLANPDHQLCLRRMSKRKSMR